MLDVEACRAQFPSLHLPGPDGRPAVFLDGPGGSQVPQAVIDAVSRYLTRHNANRGGAFATSRESDALLEESHRAAADLLHAWSPDEVVFGLNMTSLTFHLSRALARTWGPGDAVLVTRLDHDANVRPWALAAGDAGLQVRFAEVLPSGELDEESFRHHLRDGKVKLAAFTCASNAIGTIPDVARLTALARDAGALTFLDAVHYAPHAAIDVQAWGCDFLACSMYKLFGPHVGILWGRRGILRGLAAYKVRPAPDEPPGKWMTGTQNHEGIAGALAAINYLASLGKGSSRRERLTSAFEAIRRHEEGLRAQLTAGLREVPGVQVWGPPSPCAPTVAITADGAASGDLSRKLGDLGVYTWSGHFYAVELAERLGVMPRGGFVRLGLLHYNTAAEVTRAVEAVRQVIREARG
jgi:cysteine desulfurase family protein (TIGR01976 family)